jgi:hypothetical protein
MKRAFAIAAVAELAFAIFLMHSEIKEFFWTHPWWRSLLASMPAIAVAGFAYFEWLHSGEVSELNREANLLRDEANEFRKEANRERTRANEALNAIADNTKRTPTRAERNAERLQKYLRHKAQIINADDSRWSEAAEIVEIRDEVITLFTPYGFSSSTAIESHVHCDDLEIIEAPSGSSLLGR